MAGNIWEEKRRVIRHYDRLAKIYDSLYGDEQRLKIKEILNAIDLCWSDLVLDVGCGTGLLFGHIHDLVSAIVGVDISLGALMVAKDFIKRIGLKNVSLVRADADYLPFKDGIFDKVFAITLLQNLPNPILTLHEILRVSKKDSLIAVTGLKKSFSRRSFLEILFRAGMPSSIIECDENVKCHIAICSRETVFPTKNINMREGIEMCSSVVG
ncbi:MAG: methyltransferase domain-containing protein [Candidatus Bathyarchaeia archaeon]